MGGFSAQFLRSTSCLCARQRDERYIQALLMSGSLCCSKQSKIWKSGSLCCCTETDLTIQAASHRVRYGSKHLFITDKIYIYIYIYTCLLQKDVLARISTRRTFSKSQSHCDELQRSFLQRSFLRDAGVDLHACIHCLKAEDFGISAICISPISPSKLL